MLHQRRDKCAKTLAAPASLATHTASLHAAPTHPQSSKDARAARWPWQPTGTDDVLPMVRSMWGNVKDIEVANAVGHVKIMSKHVPKWPARGPKGPTSCVSSEACTCTNNVFEGVAGALSQAIQVFMGAGKVWKIAGYNHSSLI